MAIPKVSLRRIKALKPCSSDFAIAKKLYPDGVPLTMVAYKRLQKAGADPAWGVRELVNKSLGRPKHDWSGTEKTCPRCRILAKYKTIESRLGFLREALR